MIAAPAAASKICSLRKAWNLGELSFWAYRPMPSCWPSTIELILSSSRFRTLAA